jgi:antirestriction protein
MTTTTATERRIWIGVLSDYNAGYLTGEWVDVDGKDADELRAEADRILKTAHDPNAEEFAIFDHEGFGGWIEEYTPLFDVAEFAAQMDAASDEAAFLAWLSYHGADDLPDDVSDYAERFGEEYAGQYSTAADYAHEFADMTGELENMSDELIGYIDFEKYADHVLRNYGYHFERAGAPDYGVYAFSPSA